MKHPRPTNPLERLTWLALEGGPELHELLKDVTAEELLEALRARSAVEVSA